MSCTWSCHEWNKKGIYIYMNLVYECLLWVEKAFICWPNVQWDENGVIATNVITSAKNDNRKQKKLRRKYECFSWLFALFFRHNKDLHSMAQTTADGARNHHKTATVKRPLLTFRRRWAWKLNEQEKKHSQNASLNGWLGDRGNENSHPVKGTMLHTPPDAYRCDAVAFMIPCKPPSFLDY